VLGVLTGPVRVRNTTSLDTRDVVTPQVGVHEPNESAHVERPSSQHLAQVGDPRLFFGTLPLGACILELLHLLGAFVDERAKKAKLVALELLVEPFLDLAAAFGVGGPVGEVRFARTDSC
jgi:hypothetical protein